MINIENVADFSNIGKVAVTNWGQQNTNGELNDCYWNIAKNQLGENATGQEITDLTGKLLELNAPKDTQGNYNLMLYAGQTIILDVDSTIKQSQEAVQEIIEVYSQLIQEENQKSQNYNALIQEYNNKITELGQYNKQFNEIFNSLNPQNKETIQHLSDILNAQSNIVKNLLALEKTINQTTNPYNEENKEIKDVIEEQETLNLTLNSLKEEYIAIGLDDEELKKLNNFIEEFNNQIKQMNLELIPQEQQHSKEIEYQIYLDNSNKMLNLETPEQHEIQEPVEIQEENTLDFQDFKSLQNFLTNPGLNSDDFIKKINDFYENNSSLAQFIDKNYKKDEKVEISKLFVKRLDNFANEGNNEAITILCQEIYNSTAGMFATADEYINAIIQNCSDETICKIMDNYSSITNSELYNDIKNDFSGNDEKEILSKFDETYKNTKNKSYSGWNDGKLSNSEKLEAIGQGVLNKTPQIATSVAIAAATPAIASAVGTALAGSAIGAAIPFVAPVLIVAGIGFGGYLAYKGVKEGLEGYKQTKNAQTDFEAKNGIIQTTQGSIDTIEGTVIVASSIKSGVNLVKSYKNATTATSSQKTTNETSTNAKTTTKVQTEQTAQQSPDVVSQVQNVQTNPTTIDYAKILDDFDLDTLSATDGIKRFKALRCLNNVVQQETSPEVQKAYQVFVDNQNDETLKKLYHALSKSTHPDLHPDCPELSDGFSLYSRLYEILYGNLESIKF